MRRSYVMVGAAAAAALAGGAVLAVAVLSRTGHVHRTAARAHAAASPKPPASSPTAAPGPNQLVPVRLVIPRIGVNATVEAVGLDSQGAMAVPAKPVDVAWYAPGPAPGEPGDAVIDGHLDWYGVPRAVFYDLDKLRPGDEIDVESAAGSRQFEVTDSRSYPYTAHPAGLFDTSGDTRLSLITCAGPWDKVHGTYAQRLVVTARKASPAPPLGATRA